MSEEALAQLIPMKGITDPGDTDVLCGRGGAALRHPGNQTYRRLVNLNKGLYITCLKTEKLKISRSIVAAIREQRGRFLEKEQKSGTWYDIGDKKAIEKTSQALREGQPKLRQKIVEMGGAAAMESQYGHAGLYPEHVNLAAAGVDPSLMMPPGAVPPSQIHSSLQAAYDYDYDPSMQQLELSMGGGGSMRPEDIRAMQQQSQIADPSIQDLHAEMFQRLSLQNLNAQAAAEEEHLMQQQQQLNQQRMALAQQRLRSNMNQHDLGPGMSPDGTPHNMSSMNDYNILSASRKMGGMMQNDVQSQNMSSLNDQYSMLGGGGRKTGSNLLPGDVDVTQMATIDDYSILRQKAGASFQSRTNSHDMDPGFHSSLNDMNPPQGNGFTLDPYTMDGRGNNSYSSNMNNNNSNNSINRHLSGGSSSNRNNYNNKNALVGRHPGGAYYAMGHDSQQSIQSQFSQTPSMPASQSASMPDPPPPAKPESMSKPPCELQKGSKSQSSLRESTPYSLTKSQSESYGLTSKSQSDLPHEAEPSSLPDVTPLPAKKELMENGCGGEKKHANHDNGESKVDTNETSKISPEERPIKKESSDREGGSKEDKEKDDDANSNDTPTASNMKDKEKNAAAAAEASMKRGRDLLSSSNHTLSTSNHLRGGSSHMMLSGSSHHKPRFASIDRRHIFAKMKYKGAADPKTGDMLPKSSNHSMVDGMPDIHMVESQLSLYSNVSNMTDGKTIDNGKGPPPGVEIGKVIDHSREVEWTRGIGLGGGSRHSIMSGLSRIDDASIDQSIFSDLSRKIGNVSTRSIAMSEISAIDMQERDNEDDTSNSSGFEHDIDLGGTQHSEFRKHPTMEFDL